MIMSMPKYINMFLVYLNNATFPCDCKGNNYYSHILFLFVQRPIKLVHTVSRKLSKPLRSSFIFRKILLNPPLIFIAFIITLSL